MKVKISTYDKKRGWDLFSNVMEIKAKGGYPSIWPGVEGSDIDIITDLTATWRTEPFGKTGEYVTLIIEREVKEE